MKRDVNIDLFRCLCMFGIVCIHTFSYTNHVSHGLWALCCSSLIGFVLMSAWFGIHFRPVKALQILGTTICCASIAVVFVGGGLMETMKGYWYVWAYLFLMAFSPVVDDFVERCEDRHKFVMVFATLGFVLWGWCFLSVVVMPTQIPVARGLGDANSMALLLNYVLFRIMMRLGWIEWISMHLKLLCVAFVASGVIVYCGFRHMCSIVAFVFALVTFLLVRRLKISYGERLVELLSPSMFSVYLLHMPLCQYFPDWEEGIFNYTHFPHGLCQFALAILVFFCTIIIDIPRRVAVYYGRNLLCKIALH